MPSPGGRSGEILIFKGFTAGLKGTYMDTRGGPDPSITHQEEEKMAMKEALLMEYDYEMANTRRALERLPSEKFGWKPHEKSFSMGDLATHIITIPDWAVYTISQDVFDMSPDSHPAAVTSTKELLEKFDKNVAHARKALAETQDEHLLKPWTFSVAGKVLFTMPRIQVLRGFVMNHLVHHRGQLTVYMRENNIPVPALYGPSADEQGM
jgi:uncharacterized damage-inducible protein DinB